MKNIRKYSRQHVSLRLFYVFIAAVFSLTVVTPPSLIFAQTVTSMNLPVPGTMITQSPGYTPTLIRGITIHADNPLMFDFIIDSGDSELKGEALKAESLRMVKYFFASLTVPEEELWVNLSPYEGNRIIPETFGITDAGVSLLAQDYMLKQLAASMIYPEEELGKDFWERVYKKAEAEFGEPAAMFNKVWIVPDEAMVLEKDNTAYVIKSHLKVMLEEDYYAMSSQKAQDEQNGRATGRGGLTEDMRAQTEALREMILPEIEKEVNEGENFARLRQVYNAVILASWYKNNLKDSLLGQIYVDQNKVAGVDTKDPAVTQEIYKQYVKAYEQGVYSYIKEEYDPQKGRYVPRKYFAGGVALRDAAQLVRRNTVKAADVPQMEGALRTSITRFMDQINQRLRPARELTAGTLSSAEAGVSGRAVTLEDVTPLSKVTVNLDDVGPGASRSAITPAPAREPGIVKTTAFAGGSSLLAEVFTQIRDNLNSVEVQISKESLSDRVAGRTESRAAAALSPVSVIKVGALFENDLQNQPDAVQHVQVEDAQGNVVPLTISVPFDEGVYQSAIYTTEDTSFDGTPLFLVRSPEMFQAAATDQETVIRQSGYLSQAYIQLAKELGLTPDVVRVKEPTDAVFVESALKNQLNLPGQLSRLTSSQIVLSPDTASQMTAAGTVSAETLKSVVGADMVSASAVSSSEGGAQVINFAEAVSRMPNIVNLASAPEIRADAAMLVPTQQYSAALSEVVTEKGGAANVTALDINTVKVGQKARVNQTLFDAGVDAGFFQPSDNLLIAAASNFASAAGQRLNEALEQIAATPGTNVAFVVPAGASENERAQAARINLVVQNQPALQGRIVVVDQASPEVVTQLAGAADVALNIPQVTLSGATIDTTAQLAALNGTPSVDISVAPRAGGTQAAVDSFYQGVTAAVNLAGNTPALASASEQTFQTSHQAYGTAFINAIITNFIRTIPVVPADAAVPDSAQRIATIKSGIATQMDIASQERRLESLESRRAAAVRSGANSEAITSFDKQIADVKVAISQQKEALAQAYTTLGVDADEAQKLAADYTAPSLSSFVTRDKVGGIDLNPELLDMVIRRDGNGVPLPISDQPMEKLKNIQGFLPVIMNVAPMQSLPPLTEAETEAPTVS